MALQTTFLYKVFDPDGEYLGLMPNVVSDFEENQLLNTPGYEIDIEIGTSPDNTESEVEAILDETGAPILDESSEPILSETISTVIGDNTMVNEGNRIEVWLFNDDYPSGLKRFNGYISEWEGNFGGSENIKLKVLSYGVQLSNFIIESGESAVITQTVQNAEADLDVGSFLHIGQTFTATSTDPIGAVEFTLRNNGIDASSCKLRIFEGNLTGQHPETTSASVKATVNRSISSADFEVNRFTFPEFTPTNGQVYTIVLTVSNIGIPGLPQPDITIQYNNAGGYAGGAMLGLTRFDTAFSAGYFPGDDTWFKVYSVTGNTTAAYNSFDPADIFRDIIDDFNAHGGVMTYDDNSIEDTGETVSYTFKVNTHLEGSQKVRQLSPSDWSWRGDPSTDLLHLHPKGTTADHTFILRRHFSELNLKRTMENVRNIVYFTGGDTGGGENLFKKSTNTTSIDRYGQQLERLTDNRVTLSDTATILSDDVLNRNNVSAYRTKIRILATKYNIWSINLGDMVGLVGFYNFIDNLLLQIVGIKRNADFVELSLDTVPPRVSRRVEDIKRNLENLETINNPDEPS